MFIDYEVTCMRKKGVWVKEIWHAYKPDHEINFPNTEFYSDMSKIQSKVASYIGGLENGLYKMGLKKLQIINELMHLVEWYGKNKTFEIDFDKLTLNVFKRSDSPQTKLF